MAVPHLVVCVMQREDDLRVARAAGEQELLEGALPRQPVTESGHCAKKPEDSVAPQHVQLVVGICSATEQARCARDVKSG